ncbi:MAG: tRNA-dihydrouridine synthase family protein [Deltaproteobacteria bacterium]|nr:tRNA-dihydrouridine synthase family protein [Deltaproteobacteria bacterium]
MAPFSLGPLPVDPPLVLAPMAGLTDPPFRRLVARLGGCGLMVTPMLTPTAVRAHEALHIPIGTGVDGAPPLAVQLAPVTAADVADSLPRVLGMLDPAAIDINMGCAAPYVRRAGCGAGLASDPSRALAVVSQARRLWQGALTVKLRAGESPDPARLLSFLRTLVDAGVTAVFFHGRLLREKFKREARWDLVAALVEGLDVPVVGNGDVGEPCVALRHLSETGCAGIMIGRSALANPWIFAQTAALARDASRPAPSNDAFRDAILGLIEDIGRSYDPGRARARVALVLPYLLDRFPFGRRAAIAASCLPTVAGQHASVASFLERAVQNPNR